MSDTVIVKVRDGILRAFEASDPDYPGIWVEFVANNDCQSNDLSRPSVLMERPLGGELRALIWADKNNEDYTEEVVFQPAFLIDEDLLQSVDTQTTEEYDIAPDEITGFLGQLMDGVDLPSDLLEQAQELYDRAAEQL